MHGGSPVEGVDHLVVAVRSLEAAARRYRALGFRVSPRGGHPALGSANHTIMFSSGDYAELLEADREGPFTTFYRDFAAAQEGLAGLALRVEDAGVARETLAQAGLNPEDTLHFSRPVDLDGRTEDARFTVVQLPLGSVPGGRVFLTQHHTPELVWRPELLDHPNAALGIKSVTVLSEEPEAAAADYLRLAPQESIARDGEALSVRLHRTYLEFMRPVSFFERHGDDPVLEAPLPRFAAVRLCVSDLDRTAAVLTVNGVRFATTEGRLEVFSSDALGTRLIFEPRPVGEPLVPWFGDLAAAAPALA